MHVRSKEQNEERHIELELRDRALLDPLTKGQVLYSNSIIFSWMIRYGKDFAMIFIRILELKIPSLTIAPCNMIKNPACKRNLYALKIFFFNK